MPIALATARANNVVFVSGSVTLSDPTAPGLAAAFPAGVLRPASRRSCSGRPPIPRAELLRSPTRSTAARRSGSAGLSCSWLCGTAASGDATHRPQRTRRRPHSIAVYASSYADARCRRGPVPVHASIARRPRSRRSTSRPTRPRPVAGWWGHAPIALSLSTGTAADVVSSRLLVYGPAGALVLDETSAGALTAAVVPAVSPRGARALRRRSSRVRRRGPLHDVGTGGAPLGRRPASRARRRLGAAARIARRARRIAPRPGRIRPLVRAAAASRERSSASGPTAAAARAQCPRRDRSGRRGRRGRASRACLPA